MKYVELDGVAWCSTHDSPWYEGDTICQASRFGAGGVDDDCTEIPVFIRESDQWEADQ